MNAVATPVRYFGLDLTAGSRASGYATLDAEGVLVDVGLVGSGDEIVALIVASGAAMVAIDCPLSLPTGLCCLDAACVCVPANTPGTRACERGVSALGYGIYYTTKRTFIRRMTERGIALAARLRAMGLEVIEVYPYATKAALFGKAMPAKASVAGRAWLAERMARLVPRLGVVGRALSHDELDAVVCAYTALLFDRGEAMALGDAREGTIVVPAPASAPSFTGEITAKFAPNVSQHHPC